MEITNSELRITEASPEPQNRYICHVCGLEFEQTDFSDYMWSLFCSMGCVFAWCREMFPEPKKAGVANSE